MADPDQLLDVLQADMVAILQNTPTLSNAYVFTGTEKDFATRLKKTFSTRTDSSAGKRGLAIQVLPVFVTEAESNLPGPPLKLRCQILVIENVRLNRAADTGTLKTSSQAALNVLGALHLHGVGNHALYAEKNPITPEKAGDGFEAHVVTVYVRANGLKGSGKCASVEMEESLGSGTRYLSISGITPAVPVLIEAGVRYGQPLFTESGTDADGQPACYWTGSRWVIYSAFDYSWQSAIAAAATPDLASGWEAQDLAAGDPQIVMNEEIVVSGTLSPDATGTLKPAGFAPFDASYPVFTSDGNQSPTGTGLWVKFYFSPYDSLILEAWEDEGSEPIGRWFSTDAGADATPSIPIWEASNWTPLGDATGTPAMALASAATLTLTCGTAESSIYYTTDGSYPAPTNDSATLYTTPILTPDVGTLVRAAAYKSTLNPGDVLGFYIRPDA